MVKIYDGATWKNGTELLEEMSGHLEQEDVDAFEVKSTGSDMFIRFEADEEQWDTDFGFEFYYHTYKPLSYCGDETPLGPNGTRELFRATSSSRAQQEPLRRRAVS